MASLVCIMQICRNELSHCLLSAEAIESVDDDDNEEFPLDDCTFPTAKKPESYRDVSIQIH